MVYCYYDYHYSGQQPDITQHCPKFSSRVTFWMDAGKEKQKVVRDKAGKVIPANYCSSPFHLYRLPSGKAYHVGKYEQMLYELEAMECSLGDSVAKLKRELAKVGT